VQVRLRAAQEVTRLHVAQHARSRAPAQHVFGIGCDPERQSRRDARLHDLADLIAVADGIAITISSASYFSTNLPQLGHRSHDRHAMQPATVLVGVVVHHGHWLHQKFRAPQNAFDQGRP